MICRGEGHSGEVERRGEANDHSRIAGTGIAQPLEESGKFWMQENESQCMEISWLWMTKKGFVRS